MEYLPSPQNNSLPPKASASGNTPDADFFLSNHSSRQMLSTAVRHAALYAALSECIKFCPAPVFASYFLTIMQDFPPFQLDKSVFYRYSNAIGKGEEKKWLLH
jgi:hypothetical protein